MSARRQIIEEIIPVRGLSVTLNVDPTVEIRSVRLEPNGLDLDYTLDEGVLRTTVPELSIHSMVVVQQASDSPVATEDEPWYDRAWRRLILEFDHGDGHEYLTDLDAVALADTVAAAGVDMIWVDARGNGGTLLHATNAGPKNRSIGDRDFIGEFTTALRERGVEYGFYVNMSRDGWSYEHHPEWRQVWHDGKYRGDGPDGAGAINPDWENMCHNSPHREYNYAIITELVEGYRPAAMWLDRFDWGGVLPDSFTCTCPYCEAKFARQTGHAMPRSVDWESPAWLAFVRWRSQVLTDYFIEVRETIRALNREVSVCLNTHNGLDMFGTWFHGQDVEELMGAADHIAQEIHYEREGYLGHALIPRFTRAASGGRPMEALSFRHTGEVDFALKPEAQMLAEAAALIANGCAPLWDDMVYPQGQTEPAVYARLAKAYAFVAERKQWLGGAPKPWAAVLFSKDTRLVHGRDDMASKYLFEFLGTCQALLEAHLPFDIITDRDVTAERLGQYAVVLTPNAACLSADQVQSITEYVRWGGGLVSSHQVGMFDRDGRSTGCQLAEVLGADVVEPFTLTPSYLRFNEEEAVTLGLEAGFPYTHRAASLKTRVAEGATAVGRFALGREGLNRLSAGCHPPMASSTAYPAAVANDFGDGRSLYFPGLPGAVFAEWGHTVGKSLIAGAAVEVARVPAPLKVEAPLCVEATVYEHAGRGQTVVHLVNLQSNLARSWELMTERFVI